MSINNAIEYFVLDWLLVSFSFILVCIRLYVRVHVRGGILHRDNWRWSDIFVVCAWVNYAADAAANTAWWKMGIMGPGAPMNPAVMTAETYSAYLKGFYATSFIFLSTQYWVKLSMLCLYAEFTPPSMVKTWWAIRILFIYVLAAMVGGSCWWYFHCWPAPRNWDLYHLLDSCDWKFVNYWTPQIVLQVSTDIFVWSLPFALLPSLHHDYRAAAAAMFAIGLLSTVSCMCFHGLNITLTIVPDLNNDAANRAWMYLRLLDITTAVVVACIPGLKVFAKRKEPGASVKELSRIDSPGKGGNCEKGPKVSAGEKTTLEFERGTQTTQMP